MQLSDALILVTKMTEANGGKIPDFLQAALKQQPVVTKPVRPKRNTELTAAEADRIVNKTFNRAMYGIQS